MISQLNKKSFKYEDVFNYYANAIKIGTLKGGEKLNSLRTSASQFNCSLSVVMQAYRELESMGYIRAVEKSGYFILPYSVGVIPEPQKYNHSLKSLRSRSNNLVGQIMDMSSIPGIIPLGAAIPDSSILSIKKMTNILSKTVKAIPDCLNMYTSATGDKELKIEIARYMLQKGVTLNIELISKTLLTSHSEIS